MIQAAKKHWVRETERVITWLVLGGLAGYFSGYFWHFITIITISYIIWVIWQLKGIERWLQNDRVGKPPETIGFWGDTCYRIFHLQHKQDILREQVEEELSKFRDSFASLAEAVVMFDENERLIWCNAAAQMHLGLQLEKHLGQRLDWHWSNDKFWAYYRRGEYKEPFEMNAPLEADRILSVQISNFGVNNKVMFARDVTDIHRLEQMRRDFVSNVSHELRTPLTVLTGYIENLTMLEDQLPTLKKPLQQMAASSERMELLIKDLLVLAKLETSPHTMHSQVVGITQLLKTIVDAAKNSEWAEGRTLELDIKHDLMMHANETQLHSAFMNLVSNALKYSDEGDTVTLSCWIDPLGLHVQVKDTGIGFDAKHIPRLTERFYRVDESRSTIRPGTGLGLAIVKHVLVLHDAELIVDSVINEGSEFTCLFPSYRIASPEDSEALSSTA